MVAPAQLELMHSAAVELGVEVDRENWCKIAKILGLLDQYRRSLNLTGSRTWVDLQEHAAEALVAMAAARRAGYAAGSWLDIGSGAGFPGLIVACVWPDAVTLVEPRAKRTSFLELAAASIRSDVVVRRGRVRDGRAEVLDRGPALHGGFQIASARAVFSPETWRREAVHWVSGIFLVHGRPGVELLRDPVGAAEWGPWRVEAHVSRGTAPG